MRSLNARWVRDDFHRSIAELVTISSGDTILDLGCGRGAALTCFLDRVGPSGRVVALDRNPGLLQEIKEQHADDIASGRLKIANADIAAGLPFGARAFDVVVCQNVLECVRDRTGLIEQARARLKPGGRLLFGHHDFDGVILASGDRELTRRLVHGFADFTEEWQDVSEGQMGRLLPELMAAGGFVDATTETILFVDLELTPESYARAYLNWVRDLAPKFGIREIDAERWLAELEARTARAAFYFAIPWVYVIGRT
jgi:SAM-dependent methyltransferase